MLISGRAAWVLLLLCGCPAAQEIVVEGQATIRQGDIGQARDIALRRALSIAAASGSAQISSLVENRGDGVSDSTRVVALACTQGSRVVGESIQGDQMVLSVAVTLDRNPNCLPKCQPAYVNKVAVSGFALEFPQQIEAGERPTIAYDTAVELTRRIANRNRILAVAAETSFPYRATGRAVAEDRRKEAVAAFAKARRAQYVVSGIWRDFSIRRDGFGGAERRMVLEAAVLDGVHGGLLASRRFMRVASGDVLLRHKPPAGSAAFLATDIGRAWSELLDEAAAWSVDVAACLPFFSRVLKTEGKRIFVDAGAEHGLTAGDALRLHAQKELPVATGEGSWLGQEKTLRGMLNLKWVYPGFAIAEFATAGFNPAIQSGDLLYLQ